MNFSRDSMVHIGGGIRRTAESFEVEAGRFMLLTRFQPHGNATFLVVGADDVAYTLRTTNIQHIEETGVLAMTGEVMRSHKLGPEA